MCRFLLIKSKKANQPKELLNEFALMCKNNTEWQGDGWGVAWRIEDGRWEVEKSLKPIWEEIDIFNQIPHSNTFAVHARGASFPKHKGNIEFNQPYVEDDLCFVFNGELYGVTLKAEGKIGAQKIFSLLKQQLALRTADLLSLQRVRDELINYSKSILGMNIGFVSGDTFYVSCFYGDEDKKDYYTVRYYNDESITLVCSENISHYSWKDMKKGEIIKL